MKYLVITLLCGLLLSGTASAQRFRVGVRGGVNFTDYKFSAVTVGETRFTPGPARVGFEAGFVMRLNITRHLHLQSELNYAFVNYNLHAAGTSTRDLVVKTQRFQIPVELGLQFGVLRLFGGPVFRVADSSRSNVPRLLKIEFNDSDIGLTGGLGVNISKFFLDFRISGYPKSHIWQDFTSDGARQRVKVAHDITYGASLGFFF